MRKKKAKININKKIIILFYLVREILDLLYEYKHRPNIVQKIIAFQFVKKLPFGNIGIKNKIRINEFPNKK